MVAMTAPEATDAPSDRSKPRRRFTSLWGLKLLLVVLAGFLLIQLVPYGVDNPPDRNEPTWDSARTKHLFMQACSACHSNQTKILWFEHVAPVKWYVANHVKEGRAALNIDAWTTNPGREADHAWGPLQDGSMPPSYYHYFGLHQDAKLTAKETRELIDGLRKTIAADPPTGAGGH